MANLDYPLFPIFAFFGFVLPLIPLPWHFQAWNSGTCYFMLWASLACLNQFVNSIIWKGNVINSAPVWCDISIRITMGAIAGLPASSFCIVRRLYGIAAVRNASITRAEKRRAIIIDSLICVLGPMIYIALQYIVQGHRFNIFEDVGCMPALYNTIPLYFITYSWSLIFGLVSAVYCVLSLRAFAQRRLEFAQFISCNKTLTIGRYFRLMALAMTELMCTIPLSVVTIWLTAATTPISPWISLANTHIDFSRVEQFPSVIYEADPKMALGIQVNRWASVVCALIFFGFFGFAEEARRNYAIWGRSILRTCGIQSSLPPFFSDKKRQRLPAGLSLNLKLDSTSTLPKHYVVRRHHWFLCDIISIASRLARCLYNDKRDRISAQCSSWAPSSALRYSYSRLPTT
ncbi:pheromone receptor [Lentinula edodes]|uniref:Pheromone receptor n=1 Tax=Lentinula edodes TaxID=5353 RepID=A0A1Q3ECB9_LENED|nr:pheromone receptor [Lentinula edodes]